MPLVCSLFLLLQYGHVQFFSPPPPSIILRAAEVIVLTIFIVTELIRILLPVSTVPTPKIFFLLTGEEVVSQCLIAILVVTQLLFQQPIGLTHIEEARIGRLVVIFMHELCLFLGHLTARVDEIGWFRAWFVLLGLVFFASVPLGFFGVFPGKGEGAGAAWGMMDLGAEASRTDEIVGVRVSHLQ